MASSKSSVSCIGDISVEYNVRNGYDPKNDFLANTTYQAMIDSVSTEEATMTYAYDDLGRLISVNRPIDGNKGTVSYKYNIQGWLTDIESCSFKEHLYYNEGLGSPLYAGNISSISWNNRVCDRNMGYRFIYDSLNRLTDSEYGEDDFSKSLGNYDERLSYDWNGNVTTLVRNGKKQDGTFGEIDNLSMDYDGNQLRAVEENAASVFFTNAIDLKRSSDEISYNSNGSIVMDGTRGITNIRYDNNNNPVRIQFDNGNVTKYIYSATGQKLRTIHYTAVDNVYVDMGQDYEDIEDEYLSADSTDYFIDGSIIFTNGKFSKILFDEGYVNADYVRAGPYCRMRPYKHAGMSDEQFAELMKRWIASMNRKRMVLSFKFYNKDHLGNIREVVSKSDSIQQVTNYYPFGTPIYDLSNNPEFQPFKYNGKELDMMHGLNTLDYGARQYNSVLPLWDRVDPLAEDYYNVSPYVYCMNNPTNAIDPNGKSTWVVICGNGMYQVVGGNLNDNDRNIYVGTYNEQNVFVPKKSIGVSTSTTSFYNSDANNGKGAWAIGSVINISDRSGADFLNKVMGLNVTLDDYIGNAQNNHPYDFKVTNGGDKVISRSANYIYRGMPIGKDISGKTLYTSARDIGNMAAGIVAAKNGLPWSVARVAFDGYQSRHGLQVEGVSTRNAEYYGWSKTYSHSNGITEAVNIGNTINSILKKLWNLLF